MKPYQICFSILNIYQFRKKYVFHFDLPNMFHESLDLEALDLMCTKHSRSQKMCTSILSSYAHKQSTIGAATDLLLC